MEMEMKNCEEERFWKKGKIIGQGGFSTVSLATTHHHYLPSLMAVKYAEFSHSISLVNERIILSCLKTSPYIIKYYGDDFTYENGCPFYNLFLEYASGGSLADRIKKTNGSKGLPESQVKLYSRLILEGLKNIHQHGYVHCDIKPDNILIVSNARNPEIENMKIADFGLAKRVGEENKSEKSQLRGTLLYMAPESIIRNEYEPNCDVWALGCVVVEMLTGEKAWKCPPDTELCALLYRIALGTESPCIPKEISKEGRDFLNMCFMRDTSLRWTPDMLLNHPFVARTVPIDLPQLQSPALTCLPFKKRQRFNNLAEEMKKRPRPSIGSKRSTTNVPHFFCNGLL